MINFRNYIKNKKAFIPFVTAGDPNLDTTKEVIKTLIKALNNSRANTCSHYQDEYFTLIEA